MNPDELRPPDTDEEPRQPVHDQFFDLAMRGLVIYTVTVLAGLTLAAIAWRMLR